MIYVENIFICIAAPLVIALFFLSGNTRRFVVFFVIGLATCLITAYINSFIVLVVAELEYHSMTAAETLVRLTPICEEVIKALPVYFYVAVFATKRSDIVGVAVAVGLGFATLENCGYIVQYGAQDMLFTLIRGFSAGVMHASCAALLGYGLAFVYGNKHFAAAGSFAFLCMAITYHAIYNLLVMAEGAVLIAGYILPVVTAAIIFFLIHRPGNNFMQSANG